MTNAKAAARSKRRGRGVNKTGRSKRSPRFVMLYHWLLNSPAWKSLGPVPRALYLALKERFNGSNNGKIGMAVRAAAHELRISKDTASKAFRELEAKGFIRAAQRGNFNWKKRHASEWILTEENYRDELPTKEFMRWLPPEQKAGPKQRTYSPKLRTDEVTEKPLSDVTVLDQGPKTLN